MSIKSEVSARKLVFELLIKSEKAKQYSNIALDNALEATRLSDPDLRLASALFYGVIEKKITLDHRISELSSRPINDIDPQVKCAIRMGLYQLIFMERIPAHAAIMESVSLVPKRSAGFVNAVLRAHTRAPLLSFPDPAQFPVEYLSTSYSVCAPLCKRLVKIFGFERTESLLKAASTPSATTLRVNTLKISREELAAQIENSVPTKIAPYGLKIKGSVRGAYGFDEGLFFVQDEASQICVEAIDVSPDMSVMDVCACPGSKTFGAAINMKNIGRVCAYDLHENKLSLVSNGAERLGISIVEVARQDGREPIDSLFGSFDRVICDVPCSGFGVIAKKPELRYKDPAESAKLPEIQRNILNNASRYLKKNGVLIYSTCTVLPEENEEIVLSFLKSHNDFELTPFHVGALDVPNGYITLTPDVHGTDGFFIAKLTKRM